MPIPTELVGSLPRPMALQDAYAEHDEGKITWEQLVAAQDDAAADSIHRLQETGEPIVTEGEQRESSFATYPLTHPLAGTGLGPDLASLVDECEDIRRCLATGAARVSIDLTEGPWPTRTTPATPGPGATEEVCDELVAAAEYIPVDRLGATDDCGFSPFSRDVKPDHGSPDFARDVAMQKITARLRGAQMASEQLGI